MTLGELCCLDWSTITPDLVALLTRQMVWLDLICTVPAETNFDYDDRLELPE